MTVPTGALLINGNRLYSRYFQNQREPMVRHYGTQDFSALDDHTVENLDVEYYTWHSGDTWERVARLYGFPAADWSYIALINGKPTDFLVSVGDTVIIPRDLQAVKNRVSRVS